jgi:hypothetical protein
VGRVHPLVAFCLWTKSPRCRGGLCAGRRIADLSDRYLERLLEKGSALEPSELRAAVEAEASRRRQAAAIAVPEPRDPAFKPAGPQPISLACWYGPR